MYGWHTVGLTIASQHILNYKKYICLMQWPNIRPITGYKTKSIGINMHLAQRRAIVCYPTPLNILTNAILILSTALAQRWSKTVWRTSPCIRHPDILPMVAQYVHADWEDIQV